MTTQRPEPDALPEDALAKWQAEYEKVQEQTAGPGPWTTGHELFMRAQIKTRPGAADSNGERWADNEYTGLVLASCNCGYTSGWVPRATLPTDLRSKHPSPHALPSIIPLIQMDRPRSEA